MGAPLLGLPKSIYYFVSTQCFRFLVSSDCHLIFKLLLSCKSEFVSRKDNIKFPRIFDDSCKGSTSFIRKVKSNIS